MAESPPRTRRIVALVSNPATHDSRVLREAETLARAGREVTLLARWREGLANEERRHGFVIRRVAFSSRVSTAAETARRAAPRVSQAVRRARPTAPLWELLPRVRAAVETTPLRLAVGRWDHAARHLVGPAFAYHAHDLSMLPVAARLQRRWGGHLVYDSHELFLETRSLSTLPRWLRSVWRAYERHFVARCTAIITVNDSIAGELQARYRLHVTPTVVRNCPPIWLGGQDVPRTDLLRARCGVPANRHIALYHGGLARHRGIEQFLEAMRQPPLADTVAICLGYGELRPVLELAGQEPPLRGRLFVLDAVDPADLLAWVSSADVSVACIQPTCLNYRLSSPNKLFESLAAGTPIVASRLPEIERVMGIDGKLGRLVEPERPDQIATAIRAILDLPAGEAIEIRRRCRRVARETYNWEAEAAKLLTLYGSLG